MQAVKHQKDENDSLSYLQKVHGTTLAVYRLIAGIMQISFKQYSEYDMVRIRQTRSISLLY